MDGPKPSQHPIRVIYFKIIMLLVMLTGTSAFGLNHVAKGTSYEECLFENLAAITTDAQDRILREVCRAWHPSAWKDAGTMEVITLSTADNADRKAGPGCDGTSPEGKYCADAVEVVHMLVDTDKYEYRFKQWEEGRCPSFRVASGPNGWFHIIGCSLSHDRKQFTGSAMGWTHPQRFGFTVEIEYRQK